MRLELTRPNGHYPLKVARLPIPPLLHYFYKTLLYVPRTGLEPARLSTLAPETSASTIPPPGLCISESGKRGSNSRPQPWQGCALPTELFPRLLRKLGIFCCARCAKINFLTRWQRKFRVFLLSKLKIFCCALCMRYILLASNKNSAFCLTGAKVVQKS